MWGVGGAGHSMSILSRLKREQILQKLSIPELLLITPIPPQIQILGTIPTGATPPYARNPPSDGDDPIYPISSGSGVRN